MVKRLVQLVLAVGAIVAAVAIITALGNRTAKNKTADIATQIGAAYCNDSGYELQNRLDGSKSTIYDCSLNGAMKCVTEHGGIVSDSTDEVRLLFRNTLSGGKPACVTV